MPHANVGAMSWSRISYCCVQQFLVRARHLRTWRVAMVRWVLLAMH